MTTANTLPSDGINYRAFCASDFDAVAGLCVKAHYDEISGVYDRTLFGRVMCAGSLRRSHISLVASSGPQLVAACFGGFSPALQPKATAAMQLWDEKFLEVMEPARKRAKLGGPAIEERLFRRLRSYTTADVFISRGYANSQAELNLLVVDPSWRKRGIGSALYEQMVARFLEAGARGFFIVSEDAQDIAFFEHRGLSCVSKKQVGSGRDVACVQLLARRL